MSLALHRPTLSWPSLHGPSLNSPSDSSRGHVAAPGLDWASRVVANGGAMPSAGTITAMETFRLGMVSAGLDTKMHSLCVFVPDSLIAATTPLFVGIGSGLWSNHNFVSGDLTVEGLKGDGATKYLDTGVQAKSGEAVNSVTGNVGFTVVISEASGNNDERDMGHADAGGTSLLILACSSTQLFVPGTTVFQTNDITPGDFASSLDWNRTGYVSGNSVATDITLYAASPLVSHFQLAQVTGKATTPTTGTQTIFFGAYNNNGTAALWSKKRYSFAAIHDGLSSAESATFWGLIQTLRTSLGGGTGDPIENWAARVVSLGGASPASGTKTALRTFYSGLVSNSLLSKMVSVNCVVPDSLTAMLVPLIWNAGHELWINHGFVGGDVSVNGLTSTGSPKYIQTGVIQNTAQILSDTSAGLSTMVVSNTVTAHVLGGAAGTGSQIWSILTPDSLGGVAYYFCWGFATANDYVSAVPGAFPGFITGSRTASNAIAVYSASTAHSFALFASNSSAKLNTLSASETYVMAASSLGAPVGYFQGTASFFAMHAGLNSTESGNLYTLVAALRTALGGGNP